jgi:ketosteroid isomerase-like protein
MNDIIALERAALDRWGAGDPNGYLEVYADEITYFDPYAEHRLDGIDSMRALYGPFVGKIKVDRYDMIRPRVQRHGDAAVLSYQLVSYGPNAAGEVTATRWNSTAVYAKVNDQWKSVHSHWSHTQAGGMIPAP